MKSPNKRVESDSLRRRFAPPPLAAHAQRSRDGEQDAKVISFIRQHPGSAITLAVSYVASLGFLFQFFLLREFGINSLHFVSPSDFMLAFLRGAPYIAVIVLMHLVIWLKDIVFNQRSVPGKNVSRRIRTLLAVTTPYEVGLLVLVLPIIAGYAGHLRGVGLHDGSENCQVLEITEPTIQTPGTTYLLESSAEYLFLVTDKNETLVLRRDVVAKLSQCSAVQKLNRTRADNARVRLAVR